MTNDIKLKAIIDQLTKYGMPVKFLHYVDKNMVVEKGKKGQDEVSGFFSNKILKLSPETLESLRGNIRPKPGFDSSAIQTLYHESTHAYFHLLRNKPEIKMLLELGEKWYKDAPLKYGEIADDPDYLFHEAAATYVAHRAMAHWNTLVSISLVRKGIHQRENLMSFQIDRIVKKVDRIPKDYQKETKKRVFGYENEWRGFTQQQVETIKRMPPRLKEYCDRIILERKIPDTFAQNSHLYAEYKKLLKEVAPLRLPSRPSRGGGRIPAWLQSGSASGYSPKALLR